MSVTGLSTRGIPNSLTGLETVNAAYNTKFVPYTGAIMNVDLGGQRIRSSFAATNPYDLVNLAKLNGSISSLENLIATNYLNKTAVSGEQTVAGQVKFDQNISILSSSTYFRYNSITTNHNEAYVIRVEDDTYDLRFLNVNTSNEFQFKSNGRIYCSALTANRALITNTNQEIDVSSVTNTELGYVSGVTSAIQTQLNSKLNLSGGTMAGAIDMGSFKITSSYAAVNGVDLTNKSYVDTKASNYVLKTGDTVSGTLTFSSSVPLNFTNLTQDRVVGITTGGNLVTTTMSLSDANYATGLTSNVQTQLNGKLNLSGGTMTGNLGVNQTSPQWLIHSNRTNAWSTSGAKALGIIGVGGGDNDPDYQYIVFPNPAQGDGQISGLHWWSADMLTGRYKNEFRIAWWKETHGGSLGSAYKEGITLYLTDSGGYTNLDYIKLNGKTIINGNIGIGTDPTGRLDVYSTTTDYTNNVVIRQPWAGVTFDNTQLSGGRKWHVFSGGEGAGIGKGNFGIYDGTANAYRFSIDSNGQAKFHSWFRVENGDISTCVYGPNSSWNSYLRVGAATSLFDSNTAQIISTNGNLHLDAGYSKDIFLGIYQNLAGQRGVNYHYANRHDFYSGPVNVVGGTAFAVPTGYMRSGSLTIGATDVNYGWGNLWNSNTAGLLLECSDYTEIAVHDAGTRVTSLMAYIGGAGRNDIFIGRDMGWGIPEVTIPFYRAYYSAGIPFFYNTGGAYLGTPGGSTGYIYIGGQSLVTSNNSPVNTVGNGYWYVSVAGVYALTLCGHAPGGSAEYFISLNCHNTNDLNTNGVRQLVACGYAAPECVVSWTGYLSTTDLISFGCYNNYMVTPTRLTISIVLLQRTS